MPIMQGTMQIEECEIEGYQFDFVLISRRSRERAGWFAVCYPNGLFSKPVHVFKACATSDVVSMNKDKLPTLSKLSKLSSSM